jgi:hypothetical protein
MIAHGRRQTRPTAQVARNPVVTVDGQGLKGGRAWSDAGERMIVVTGRRVVAVAAIAGACFAVSSCHATSGLSKEEIVVAFIPGATQADHTAVWNACQNLPGISEEPLVSTSKYKSTLLNNVRFRVDKASNYQLQQLYACLGKQKTVSGYNTDGSDDES